MITIDWGKLVSQGRAKAIGISWSGEEFMAVQTLTKFLNQQNFSAAAEYVRQGILTVEAYKKAKAKGIGPSKSKEELIAEAKKEGINVTPEATKESLEEVLKAKKKPEATPKPKAKIKKTSRKK